MVKQKNIITKKRENILVFQIKKSVIKKNKIIPKKALIVFDLSPVINIPIKLNNNKNDIRTLKLSFFLKLSMR